MRIAIVVGAMSACTASPAPDDAALCPGDATATARRPRQCGPTLDLTPINRYAGPLTFAQDREDAVALVAGRCTGTWIAASAGAVVLTAGHCVELGERVLVAFNVEAEPDGDPLVTEGVVIEHSTAPDYALLRLDRAPVVTPTMLTTRATDTLAIIQHPRGAPKVIGEGSYLERCDDASVVYADLDTLVGSSGAGVLTEHGALLAIHTDGDCREDGSGTNRGFGADAIVDVSAHLLPGDLSER